MYTAFQLSQAIPVVMLSLSYTTVVATKHNTFVRVSTPSSLRSCGWQLPAHCHGFAYTIWSPSCGLLSLGSANVEPLVLTNSSFFWGKTRKFWPCRGGTAKVVRRRFSIVGAYPLARSWRNPGTVTIPQYRFNKTKQHTATPGPLPLRNDPGTVTIPQYRFNKKQSNTHYYIRVHWCLGSSRDWLWGLICPRIHARSPTLWTVLPTCLGTRLGLL